MNVKAQQVDLDKILHLRELYLQENNFQIRYNACHERGWTDSYLLTFEDQEVGYGSVKGLEELKDRDVVFEFYLVPQFRNKATLFFQALLKTTQASYLECQTNDLLMSSMMFEFGKNISSEVVLFGDHVQTRMEKPGFHFRSLRSGDDVFGKKDADKGAYVLERDGEIVADGGFLTHYNFPFADLYMEVKESYRGQGLASFILQEIKKKCYKAGRVPAARCNISNPASKGSLLKAGMQVVGYMLRGEVNEF